jgi:hypothetical protein
LIARPGAIASLLRQPGWDAVLAQAIRVQSSQTARLSDLLGYVDSDIDSSAVRATDTMLQGYERSLSESERKRVSFYFSVGTQNQDPRGIMLDGESSIIVSGFHAAAGLVDLYHVMARTSWVESSADVDRLLPAPSGLMQRIGRLLRLVL